MFSFLRIRDFALIQALELEPHPGFTVLSGETGAGKSIILAAVNLLLGKRAASDLIREGSEEAVVEAQFDLDEEGELARILAEAGLEEAAGDGELVIRRVVSRQGRNRVQVSGSLSTLGLLNLLGPELVSLSGQHSHQILLRGEEHLNLLDAFGDLERDRDAVTRAVAEVRGLEAAMAEAREALAQREARRDYLEFQVKELSQASLDPEEEAELKQERDLLANAEGISSAARNAHLGLYASDGSVLETLGRVKGLVEDLKEMDPRTAGLADRVSEAFYLLEDAAHELQAYESRLSFDPARLDRVESRLHQLQRITRKYGGDVAEALATLARAREELEGLERGEERLAELQARREKALEHALGLARGLSDRRRKAAGRLARAAETELNELGMAGCRFDVRFSPPGAGALETPHGPLNRRGLETAEFFIAPNPGEGLRPLVKIASGGELSRILLALKGIIARKQGAPTLIFDEVDAGLGGAAGSVVGSKLAALSKRAQVICITHLPQIACWADRHLLVGKQTSQGRTQSTLDVLEGEEVVREVARMLGGRSDSEKALSHAREMLEHSRRAKADLN